MNYRFIFVFLIGIALDACATHVPPTTIPEHITVVIKDWSPNFALPDSGAGLLVQLSDSTLADSESIELTGYVRAPVDTSLPKVPILETAESRVQFRATISRQKSAFFALTPRICEVLLVQPHKRIVLFRKVTIRRNAVSLFTLKVEGGLMVPI